MPLSLLNALFFKDAPPEIKIEIAARNAVAKYLISVAAMVKEQALLVAARAADPLTVANVIASHFGVNQSTAAMVLGDGSAYSLATLCKGARVSRAGFRRLRCSRNPRRHTTKATRLAAYDAIPEHGARALLRFWRAKPQAKLPSSAEASPGLRSRPNILAHAQSTVLSQTTGPSSLFAPCRVCRLHENLGHRDALAPKTYRPDGGFRALRGRSALWEAKLKAVPPPNSPPLRVAPYVIPVLEFQLACPTGSIPSPDAPKLCSTACVHCFPGIG